MTIGNGGMHVPTTENTPNSPSGSGSRRWSCSKEVKGQTQADHDAAMFTLRCNPQLDAVFRGDVGEVLWVVADDAAPVLEVVERPVAIGDAEHDRKRHL